MRPRLDGDLLRFNTTELLFHRCGIGRHTAVPNALSSCVQTDELRKPITEVDPHRCHFIPIDLHLPTSCFDRLLHGQSPFCALSTSPLQRTVCDCAGGWPSHLIWPGCVSLPTARTPEMSLVTHRRRKPPIRQRGRSRASRRDASVPSAGAAFRVCPTIQSAMRTTLALTALLFLAAADPRE